MAKTKVSKSQIKSLEKLQTEIETIGGNLMRPHSDIYQTMHKQINFLQKNKDSITRDLRKTVVDKLDEMSLCFRMATNRLDEIYEMFENELGLETLNK